MIQVGIHEDLVITKTVKNDQGTLVIGVKQVSDVDPLAALSGGGQTSFEQPEQDFLIYPPKSEAYGGGLDTQKNLLNKISELKNQLDHIAAGYMPVGDRKFDPLVGTGITLANMESELNKQDVMNKVYNNVVDQFITMMAPHIGESGKKMRMLFIRQSATKHYPALRKRYLQSQPFMEPMEIPKAASKLAFSAYEKKNGLDSSTPVQASAPASGADAAAAKRLFAPA